MPYFAGGVAVIALVLVLEFCSDAALVDWLADAFVLGLGGHTAVVKVRTMRAEHRYRRAMRRLRGHLAGHGPGGKGARGSETGTHQSKVITVTPRRPR
jgi:hypothetical protein